MQGLMMDVQLTIPRILERGKRFFPRKRIITRKADGYHSYTYEDFTERVERLARALRDMGIGPGDRVATFAWNNHRHLELYFAVPCIGAVLHTVNIRLGGDQIAYIINHAEDRVVFVDDSLLPVLEGVADELETVERYVVMTDDDELPDTSLEPAEHYESVVAAHDPGITWPEIDEDAACVMCYTSGTTGDPKGVVYSHRAMVIHALGVATPAALGIEEYDRALMIVPLFHANAWGLPFIGTMVGCEMVLPGPFMEPHQLAEMIEDQEVTYAAGVPTIWVGMLQDLEEHDHDLSTLRLITGGGSAVPKSLIKAYADLGIQLLHGWGMTETGPVATLSKIKSELSDLSEDEKMSIYAKQGLALPLVELRVVGEDGEELPWDGKSEGEIEIRGPYIASSYYRLPEASEEQWHDGWLRTGDVGVIDGEGYLQLMDRKKDVIKSGGEWVSSVDLENAIMGHPDVIECAVIGVSHPKWQERPLACVVQKEGADLTREEINDFLEDKVVKWWLPDDVVFIDEVPKTSVGKFDKKVLRQRFEDYELPTT